MMSIKQLNTNNTEILNEIQSVDILDSIAMKRSGQTLSSNMINLIISDFTAGKIPDYRMSAWLATLACVGMNMDEIEALTYAYTSGGKILEKPILDRQIIDKHSTGGVGDKVTFIVVPIVAACGVLVTKISGRSLGHAGGTLDKLESIPGLKVNLSAQEFITVLRETGMVIAGQSDDLVPGDKATYQLRNISGCVESIPLIAASIISKKIVTGADFLVLDVKCGSGALIPNFKDAYELAETMIQLAKRFAIKCKVVISDMSQPLGNAVGNAIEIKEAIRVLKGDYIPNLTELCLEISKLMLQIAKPELTDIDATRLIEHVISSGKAYNKFINWACVQGAYETISDDLNNLPIAKHVFSVKSDIPGWVQSIDPRIIGNVAFMLKGDETKSSAVDHAAGIIIKKHVGDQVSKGEEIAEIHHNILDIEYFKKVIISAFTIGNFEPDLNPIIYCTI